VAAAAIPVPAGAVQPRAAGHQQLDERTVHYSVYDIVLSVAALSYLFCPYQCSHSQVRAPQQRGASKNPFTGFSFRVWCFVFFLIIH
jgi:hypothetical protein